MEELYPIFNKFFNISCIISLDYMYKKTYNLGLYLSVEIAEP